MHLYTDRYASGLFVAKIIGTVQKNVLDLPLCGVSVQANVVDFCAEVEVCQRYENRFDCDVQAEYLFPLDNRAAVTGFESEIDGVVTKANIQEKAEARQTYEHAVANGDGAQLLEQRRDDVFQMSIGNLGPGSTCIIRIKYVTDLRIEGASVVFFLPTYVAPRFTPSRERDPLPARQGPRWIHDGLSVNIVAAMGSDVTDVTYETGGIPLNIAGAGRVRRLSLAPGKHYLDKDLIVKISTMEPHQPRCLVERAPDGKTHCAVVTLAPNIEFNDKKCELIFLVDRSGSMSGSKIEQAKRALQLFIRSLPEDCYFNIVGFGSRYETLFSSSSSVKYSRDTLAKASRHVENLSANLGGTVIKAPLEKVLTARKRSGYDRQVFVLTDGQVSNTADVIRMVEGQRGSSRVFALGLGNGASRELVEGIARVGQGTSAFVINDGLETKVITQLRRALQPALDNVTIKWVGAEAPPPSYPTEQGVPATQTTEASDGRSNSIFGAFAGSSVGSLLDFSARTQPPVNPATEEGFARAPFVAPPIFSGERFMSYCLMEKDGIAPTAVHITASSPVGDLDVRIDVKLNDVVEGSTLHAMGARKLIRDLEDGTSWMGSKFGATDPTVKAEVVRLGLKYGLASKHTSYVAVQHRPVSHPAGVAYGMAVPLAAAAPCPVFYKSTSKAKKKKGMSLGGFNLFGSSAAAPKCRGRGGRGAPPVPQMSSAPGAAPRKRSASRQARSMEKEEHSVGGSLLDSLSMRRSALDDCFSVDECIDSSMDVADNSDDDWGEIGSVMDLNERAPKRENRAVSVDPSSQLQTLVALQDFTGCFELSAALSKLVGVDQSSLTAEADQLASVHNLGQEHARRIVATIVAINFMMSTLATLSDQWQLIVAKSSKWLSANCTDQSTSDARVALGTIGITSS